MNRSDLLIYLTSLEPTIAQNNYAQSIGGYVSSSQLYDKTYLSQQVGLYDQSIIVNDYNDILGLEYISINGESMKIIQPTSNTISVVSRAISGARQSHGADDTVYGISLADNIFDNFYSKNNKQYRCISIKNSNLVDTAYNVAIDLSSNSINNGSEIRIAVEVPKHSYMGDLYADSGSKRTVVDSYFAGKYSDDYFKDSVLRFPYDTYGSLNAGQQRIIQSYDDSTGTFVLAESVPYAVSYGDLFEIDAAPATRLKTGIMDDPSTSYISAFKNSGSISININSRGNDSLGPNDVIYLWLEKNIFGGYEAVNYNGFTWDISYSDAP